MEIKEGKPVTIRRKAEHSYDYVEDIFYAYPVDREYEKSVMLENFILDLDKEDEVVGIEILDYSRMLGIPKCHTQNTRKGRIKITVNPEEVQIEIMLEIVMRNKQRERLIDIKRANDGTIAPSALTCTISA